MTSTLNYIPPLNGPPPNREADTLRSALTLVKQRLPAEWQINVDEQAELGRYRADAVMRLRAPDGSSATLIIEAKRQLATRDVPYALEQLATYAEALDESATVVPMLIARYISPSTREQIEQRGAAYADATGNLRLVLERPALFLRDVGATRDPWRGPGRPPGGLKGPAAARVVRALVDYTPPFTVPQLIKLSGASTGAAYRVIDFLEREMLLERMPRGAITNVGWRALLERWSNDYSFQDSNTIVSCLQPRGIPAITEALQSNPGLRYVLTGSLAIEDELKYAPARLAMIYIDDTDDAVDRLDLRPVDSGANVLLAATDYDVVFDRTSELAGIRVAAKSQIAVDLLTAPGRGPAEAQPLLDWMSANESSWRR
ncbi:MAG TPA: hypothetical protein VIC05_10965 [Solirubrobacteraceae bacterium]|jgi:hypothetical protein